MVMGSPDFGAILYRPREEIRGLQNELLRRQVMRLALYSPYYKQLFQDLKIQPERIGTVEDLEGIPLLYKKEYMKDPQQFRLVDKMEIFDPSATLKCQRVLDERPSPVD
jgi:phenylacetate-coenzyme A ligase PaaK-like adenylate-forming protein